MGTGRVLVVGSCNLDLVIEVAALPRPGETVLGSTFRRTGGGKGANQAVAAARDGASVLFLGAVGDDDAGRFALADLVAEGVDTSAVLRSTHHPTGTAFIVVDARGENSIVVVSGANGCLDESVVSVLDRFALGPDDVLLTGFEVPMAAVEASAQLARRRGAYLVINPAPAMPLSDRLVACAPILTPNAGEAASLTGESDPEHAAIHLAARTGTWVIVTLGPAGALVVRGDQAQLVPAWPVDALDMTGAGDAFSGVLAGALAAGLDVPSSVRRANVAAALSVTAIGARAGMPRTDQIDAAAAVTGLPP
jgi:ribokinase